MDADFLHANPTGAFIRSHCEVILIKTWFPWSEAFSLCSAPHRYHPLCYLLRQPNYEVTITV